MTRPTDANDLAALEGLDAVAKLVASAASVANRPELPPFQRVPIADLLTAEIQPQQWWWYRYVPAGHVTLWSGHGGAGKSTLAAMLAVCIAMAQPFLGKATRQGRVLYFSAEDPGALVRLRLRRICAHMHIDPAELAERLQVIDATEMDAALFVEQRVGGVRRGATTPAYDALLDYMQDEAIDVVMLDNASDLFDGDEIVRPLVRAFIRSLALLVRQRGGAAVLLAHVDKGTSRAGKSAGSESYSGSTGWHNSVRSRVALLEREPGSLELQHQKSNLGPKNPPLLLSWPEGSLPGLASADMPPETATRPRAADAMRDLVALVGDYYGRGEWISTKLQSPANASRILALEARYPRHLKPAQVAQLLREAQRAKYLMVESYTGDDRKARERWAVSEAGRALAEGLPLFERAATEGGA